MEKAIQPAIQTAVGGLLRFFLPNSLTQEEGLNEADRIRT
jgi:hypothetical protein